MPNGLVLDAVRTTVRVDRKVFADVLAQRESALQISQRDKVGDPVARRVLEMAVPVSQLSGQQLVVRKEVGDVFDRSQNLIAATLYFGAASR